MMLLIPISRKLGNRGEKRKQSQARNLKGHPLVIHFFQVGPTFQRFHKFLKETSCLNIEE